MSRTSHQHAWLNYLLTTQSAGVLIMGLVIGARAQDRVHVTPPPPGAPPARGGTTCDGGSASMTDATQPHRPADHVEPPDRGGRGAGAGADAHGVLADRARVRRSLGRRVRPAGPHAGAGRHRHAGPRQLDGGVGEALHPPFPARHDEAGRCLHHQRSLDGHRPSQRFRHDDAGVQRRASWSRCSPAPAI